jgi:hypothetical protein
MLPTIVTEQAPVPPPAYHRAQARPRSLSGGMRVMERSRCLFEAPFYLTCSHVPLTIHAGLLEE